MYFCKYIIRFDDISPGMAWSKFLPLKRELESRGGKAVLGVVPECRDKSLAVEPIQHDFFAHIRRWQSYGDAILQHGTHHVYSTQDAGILKIKNNSEFAGHSYETQYKLLDKGKKILQNEDCWQPYFMAPSHSFDENTLKALSSLGFVSISDGYGFFPYKLHNVVLVPQLFSKPIRFIPGISTICIHINSMSHSQINSLIWFIKCHKDHFVDFKQVSNVEVESDRPPVTTIFMGLAVRALRFIKR